MKISVYRYLRNRADGASIIGRCAQLQSNIRNSVGVEAMASAMEDMFRFFQSTGLVPDATHFARCILNNGSRNGDYLLTAIELYHS